MSWLATLAEIDDAAERTEFLRSVPVTEEGQQRLHAAVLSHLYLDLPKATRLAAAGVAWAEMSGDPLGKALSARSEGHLAHLRGDYAQATAHYQAAVALFDAAGHEVELGRTLSSGLQALIYQGKYEEAEASAARAERIFERHGDLLRLARLDSNVGNIYFRQDRSTEALARYQRALEGFEQCGEPRDMAAAYSNLAVCSTSLGQFAGALMNYTRAREYCAQQGMAGLVARADYNIAYLHYLRGDYAEARRLYQLTREQCALIGDAYHAALCDLDEAELYLELNLTREGEQLARQAAASFAHLKMPYEQGKALVSVAIAAYQRGDTLGADKTLRQARCLFVDERNAVWPALVDQLRAVLAFHGQRFERAQRLSTSARRGLANATIPGRAAHSQILLAKLWLRAGYADRARALSREALERLGDDSSPSVRFHAQLIAGEVHESQGRSGEALAAYEGARHDLEQMRGRLDTEDLRISILSDKLAVYEALVSLHLNSSRTAEDEAFACVQQAKSRSLADRLSSSWCPAKSPAKGEPPAKGEELRKDLNWVYRQIDLAALIDQSTKSGDRASQLKARARELELELIETTRSRGGSVPLNPEAESLAGIQGILGPGEAILEYYEARGVLYLFLLSRTELRTFRLGSCVPIQHEMKLLQFQIGKASLRREHPGSPAADYHLRTLYQLLISPAEEFLLPFRHLIIAPHKNLHGLPFAAFNEGDGPLMDRFHLSFIPSASVFARCRRRRPGAAGDPVVIAVPDERAPRIAEEAREVTRLLAGAQLFLGADASLEALRRHGSGVRILHLAAHGVFRRDNPLFSSIQLADGRLSLIDLNAIDLDVDLLTLSACNTGSSVPVGGDELLGLIRGCLAAGTRSLLVTLWEIDDESAMEFMRSFYRQVVAGQSLSAAVGEAMREVRRRFRHPYYWAPYMLVGDPAPVRPSLAESGRPVVGGEVKIDS